MEVIMMNGITMNIPYPAFYGPQSSQALYQNAIGTDTTRNGNTLRQNGLGADATQNGNTLRQKALGTDDAQDGKIPNHSAFGVERKSSPEECQTCKERKYQDGSDENVSFKSAAHISPEASGARVRAHESEHVANAYSDAAKKDGKVVRASVSIQTAICPECGRTFVAGGKTNTMIKYSDESNPYQKNQKSLDAARFVGSNVDCVA